MESHISRNRVLLWHIICSRRRIFFDLFLLNYPKKISRYGFCFDMYIHTWKSKNQKKRRWNSVCVMMLEYFSCDRIPCSNKVIIHCHFLTLPFPSSKCLKSKNGQFPYIFDWFQGTFQRSFSQFLCINEVEKNNIHILSFCPGYVCIHTFIFVYQGWLQKVFCLLLTYEKKTMKIKYLVIWYGIHMSLYSTYRPYQ